MFNENQLFLYKLRRRSPEITKLFFDSVRTMYVFRVISKRAFAILFCTRADIIPKRRYDRNGFIKQVLTADYMINDANIPV